MATTEGLNLLWNGYTITSSETYDSAGEGTTYVVDTSVYVPGLKDVYNDVTSFPSFPDCKVVDNVVMRPSESAYVTTPVVFSSLDAGTRFLTSKEIEGFSVTLAAPSLYRVNAQTGYETTTVSLGIYYRAYNPANPPTNSTPWTPVHINYCISGKQRAEITKTVKHNPNDTPLPLSKYEILVVRNTADHSGDMYYADDVYVKEITEVLYHNLAYNHTALLGVKIRATDQLSGQLPTVTSLVKGIKVSVPSNLVDAYKARYDDTGNYNQAAIDAAYSAGWKDGLLGTEKVWTDNPVWCLYDLLTDNRYGLADYYKISDSKRGLMLANFYLMAKYCDEAISYVDDTSSQYLTRLRPRFAINIVLDQSKTAAEWIGQFAAIMRATVYYNEGICWIDIDKDKPVTQLFNMSNIREFTQSSTSYKAIPNSYEVMWINPLTNYEIDTFKLDSPELQLSANIEERKKALQLMGVTSFDQAKSLTKYALLAGQTRTKLVTFKTGTNGLRCSVTDVIAIQHDVPQWGYGGKVVSCTLSENEAWYTLKLSCEVTIDAQEYSITVARPGGQPETVDVFETVGTSDTINIAKPSFEPAAGDDFIVSVTSNAVWKFKVASIKRDTDDLCEITAVAFDADIFEACDNTSSLGVYNTNNYTLITTPQRVSVQGVDASNKITPSSTGVWETGVEIFYDVPADTFWRAAQLHYAKAGTADYTAGPMDSTGYFYIANLPAGDYQFVVTSIYTNGKQTVYDALKDADKHPWDILKVDSYAPNDMFLSGVSGLSIEGGSNMNNFDGRDCVVVWKRPLVVGEDTVAAGMESAGAATINTDSYFGHYLVEVYDTNAQKLREAKVGTERFVYTYEMNYADGLHREFMVVVTTYDILGRASAPKEIYCQNPAPRRI